MIRKAIKTLKDILSNLIEITKLRMKPYVPDSKPILIICIKDFNQGRYAFQLLKYFSLGGFNILIFNSFKFLSTLSSYDRFIFNIPGLYLWKNNYEKYLNEYSVSVIINSDDCIDHLTTKKLVADFNSFTQEDNKDGFLLPYYIHPYMHKLFEKESKQDHKKYGGIIFYGQNSAVYNSFWIDKYFKKLSRANLYSLLKKSGLNLTSPATYKELLTELQTPRSNSMYFIDDNIFRIPPDDWLYILAKFNFFVASPGVVMPICHNHIEAMGLGLIPILQFPEHFYPALENNVNCLSFNNPDELLDTINIATAMNYDDILALSNNVTEYFNSHLSPKSFSKKILDKNFRINKLYINAEEISILKLKETNGG